MKIVVGLGNPGEKHKSNRHNVGFMVLDQLAVGNWTKSRNRLFEHSSLTPEVELIKPATFMNASGKAVRHALMKHKAASEGIYVVYDDLDLALGKFKILKGRGPKQHNGLLSIYDALKTSDFWHVRVGVDNRRDAKRIPGEKYVLQDFSVKERKLVDTTIDQVITRIKDVLLS